MAQPVTRDEVGSPRFDVFLSYNSRDGAVVERLAGQLRGVGIEPWLDRWALTAGVAWQDEVAAGVEASGCCAVFVGAEDLGAWELQEVAVALDRAAATPGFRVFPVLLPGVREPFDPNRLPRFLRTRTWVDLRDAGDGELALQRLARAVRGVAVGSATPLPGGEEPVPYRGLRAFEERDAPWFFGRERELQRLLERLTDSRFVAVVGPSGSGKTSLVRAGLIPALLADGTADEARVLVLRPGAEPLTALAARVARLGSGAAMQATLDGLAGDERTLHLCVELALAERPGAERVVVVVDQLEEVFTLCRDDGERRSLFAVLLYAATVPGGRTVVIVTMRDDFYGRCAAYPELAQLVGAHQMLVGAMSDEGLREAIEQPARRAGLRLEDGLIGAILADVGAEPGALPLLEHTLLELWDLRRGGTMSLAAYRETGGVRGALAQRAERTYAAFDAGERQIARRVLLRLTQPGEGTHDTRRRATRDELASADAGAGADTVIAQLVDARLLTSSRDERGSDVVDVAHEALIRDWPRLRGWIDADRAGLLTHRRLTDAAREWDALGREPDALYRGARLGAAREWATDRGDLTALERDFLTASEVDAHAEVTAATGRARRRLLVLRATVGVSLLVAAIIAMLGVWALGQRSDARVRARDATSLALASLAPGQLAGRPDVALMLGLAAYEVQPRAEATDSAMRALIAIRRSGPVVGILHGHRSIVFKVAFSADGRTLASASEDGTLRLWDARTHRALGAPLHARSGAVYGVAFNADGRTLASAGADGTVRLWDARTHHARGAPLRGHDGGVNDVAFSADGRTLASAGADGTLRLWDARTHRALGAPLRGHDGAANAVAFGANGRTLASAGADGTVRLWDARTHEALGAPLRGHRGVIYGVAFGADGRMLASAGADGTVRLWDARTHQALSAPLPASSDALLGVAFSEDGRTLACAGADGTLRLWDARTHEALGAPLRGHSGPVFGVAFGADGRTLASAGQDETVRLWPGRMRRALGAPLLGHRGAVHAVAFDADGRTLASAGADGTVRLWDSRTHRALGAPLLGHSGPVLGVAFSPDRRTLASAGTDGTVRLWDARTSLALGTPLGGHRDAVDAVAFSAGGRTLASAGADGTVRLWDARTHRALGAPLRGHSEAVNAVAFDADGRTLASAGADGTVRLWDSRTHRALGAPLLGHSGPVLGVAFSADGRTLASAGQDRTVWLWDARTSRALGAPLHGHSDAVNEVAFSADGRTLASASDDGTVRLWGTRTHQALGALHGHLGPVNGVAFSADGRTPASASDDGTVRLWEHLTWRTDAELRSMVCGLVGSGLSRSEWALYVTGIPYRATCP